MKNKTYIDEVRERFNKLLETNEVYRDVLGKWGREITWQFIYKELTQEIKRAEKAYGGCTKCYGKGYSTFVRPGWTASADFEGDKEYTQPARFDIDYCSCDRGKQLKEVISWKLKEKDE